MPRNLDFELHNYLVSESAKTMRAVIDSEYTGPEDGEQMIASFDTEEDCDQFEMAVKRLRPDLKWLSHASAGGM